MDYTSIQKKLKLTDNQILLISEIYKEGYIDSKDAKNNFKRNTINSLIKRGLIIFNSKENYFEFSKNYDF